MVNIFLSVVIFAQALKMFRFASARDPIDLISKEVNPLTTVFHSVTHPFTLDTSHGTCTSRVSDIYEHLFEVT